MTGALVLGAVPRQTALASQLRLGHRIDSRRCNCSARRRTGGVGALAHRAERLARIEFQVQEIVTVLYFSAQYGIYKHHQCRSFPDQYGYDGGFLDGMTPFRIDNIPVNDRGNHPADRPSQGEG